jgi:tetratricopeptide (TPR) repeat protein
MIFFPPAFKGSKSVVTALFLLLVFIDGSVFGQVAEQTVYTHNQEFRFNANARQGSPLTINELLQILSEGSGKLRVFTGYSLHADLRLAFNQKENNIMAISLEVEKFSLNGDVQYRHFSLEKQLRPPFLNLLLQVKTPDGRVQNEIKLENIRWEGQQINNVIHELTLNNGRIKAALSVDVKRAEFHYGDGYGREVTRLGNALQSYYQADLHIQKIDSLTAHLDPSDFESAILDEFNLCEAEILLNQISNADFLILLPLDVSDPLDVVSGISRLEPNLIKLRDDFNYVIAHIDSFFYQKGLQILRVDTSGARGYFERAVVYNPFHFSAQAELGRLDIAANKPLLAMERFIKLLSIIHPPSSYKEETVAFIDFLYKSEADRAAEAMKDGRFLDALKILSEVERFCQAIISWDCPPELYAQITEVHYGMYRSYLSVATRAYTSANYSFAVNYIKSALDYKQSNSIYIKDDSEAMNLLQKVLDGYYSLAQMALVQNNFSGATSHFQSAEMICETWSNLRCRTDAAEMVQRAQMLQQSAARVSVEVMVNEPEVNLPPITASEAGLLVRDLLSKGHLKAWAGDIAGAKEILNELIPYTIRFQLRADAMINARVVSLADMIVFKECELAQRDIQALINVTMDYFRRGYLSEAKTSYDQALEIQDTAPAACSWSYSDSLKAIDYINTAAQYMSLMRDAQTAYFTAGQRGFELFVSKYKRAGNFYFEHNLERVGVKHSSLYEFTVGSSNSALIKFVISDFANAAQHEEAFQLLKILKKMGFDARQLRSLQEQAGKQAAILVHASQPAIKPAVFLEEKTGGDVWFRHYSKSFLKNWPG